MTDSQFWRSLGICTKCHKQKAVDGLCQRCKEKKRKYRKMHLKYLKKKAKEEENTKKHACYICGSYSSNQKGLCDKCYGEVVIPEFIKNRR